MTKIEIQNTIKATRVAIAGKVGGRTRYSLNLKNEILMAAEAFGPSQFSRESGLAQCLISQWKSKLGNNSKTVPGAYTCTRNRKLEINRTQSIGHLVKRAGTANKFIDQVLWEVVQLKSLKPGKPVQIPAALQGRVLRALESVSMVEFSKKSGLSRSTLCKWRAQCRSSSSEVRELIVKPDSTAAVLKTRSHGCAIIRGGNNLEIEVPLDFLTPAWIYEIVGSLNSEKGLNRA